MKLNAIAKSLVATRSWTRLRVACAFVTLSTLWLGSAFASAQVTVEQYVEEFLTEGKSEIAPDGWSPDEQLLADDELVIRLRKRSPSVVAVAILNTGIHPRYTIVFLEAGDDVRLIATHTLWGRITSKLVRQIPPSEFDEVLAEIVPLLRCGPELKDGHMTRGLVHWESGAATFCDQPEEDYQLPPGEDVVIDGEVYPTVVSETGVRSKGGAKMSEVLYPLLGFTVTPEQK